MRVSPGSMKPTLEVVKRFVRSEHGATAIEYALIASLVAVVIISAVTAVGSSVLGLYESANSGLNQ